MPHTVYILLNYISVAVMIGCSVLISTQTESKMQKYALLVCISLTMCCIGFLFRSENTAAEAMILGQKLVYIFVTHGMFLMLLFILEYCRFTVPGFVKWIFHGINLVVSVTVITMDYHPFFYKSYWAVPTEDGFASLEKEYGFMHTVAVGLFVLYMLTAVLITVIFSVKNIRKRSQYVWRIFIAVMLPCIAYFLPKITDSVNDLQPVAFAAFSIFMLYMIYNNSLYDIDNIAAKFSAAAMDEAIVVLDGKGLYKGCNKCAETLFPSLSDLNLDSVFASEEPQLAAFLSGTTKEYRVGTDIFSVQVCPIREEGGARGNVLKLKNVTMERQYTDLLKASKEDLEYEVITLSNISHTDELTGLYNRRSYEETITSIRSKGSVAGIVIGSADLNGLKKVNDTVGHAAGDELIRGAAGILKSVFAGVGQVFRIGGDEFCIILQSVPDNFDSLTYELARRVAAWKGQFCVSLSIALGFVYGDRNPKETVDRLLIMADKEMYKNKKQYYDEAQ